ncbi:uncharacterized protein LOC134812522 isoform X2 [Bolinopsis microptera]|uniref:uncharacterized protein LOC134812522 isoform X2 n=1 Tax=Bolinopsis microptera TaxID=2820187 RepID=UPI00307999DD
MAIETIQTKRNVTKRVSRRSGLIGKAHKKVRRSVSKGSELVIDAKKTVRRGASRGSETVVEAKKKVNRRVSRGFSKLKYLSPLHLKSRGVYQVPAGLGAETSLELLKKLSIPSLRRELERKKVRFSKNDGKDQLQAKLEAVLKLETCPPTCPLTKGKVVIHSEPAELKKKAQQIAVMAHNTDTPQVLGEASKQLSHVTQEVRVIRQLLEAHVHHIRAVSDHSTTECGCNMMLENLCHSLSHYHVRKLESQLQETLSEINMLQLEKHTLLRAVSRLCNKRNTPSPQPLSAVRPQRPLSAALPRSISSMSRSMATCTPCEHGDCRIDYLTSLMENVLQQHH